MRVCVCVFGPTTCMSTLMFIITEINEVLGNLVESTNAPFGIRKLKEQKHQKHVCFQKPGAVDSAFSIGKSPHSLDV